MPDSPITVSSPRYLLFSEWSQGREAGRWRFVLRANDGTEEFEADDVDPNLQGQRLELLPVVLGLEALDQPSVVTLMTPSAYVREGICHGVPQWRASGWCWEFFGKMVPVKNIDLWQRVDRAMQFHRVECGTWRFDPPERPAPVLGRLVRREGAEALRLTNCRRLEYHAARLLVGCGRGVLMGMRKCKQRLSGKWAALVPCP